MPFLLFRYSNMEKLFEKSYQKLSRVPMEFKRYLGSKIDWNSRLIGIKGARGSGKTTLLLQYAKEQLPMGKQTLYVSLDDLYFTTNNLVKKTQFPLTLLHSCSSNFSASPLPFSVSVNCRIPLLSVSILY